MGTDRLPPDVPVDVDAAREAERRHPLVAAMKDRPPLPIALDHARAKDLRRRYRQECGYTVPASLWLELHTASLLAVERERVLQAVAKDCADAGATYGCTGCVENDELRPAQEGREQDTWGKAWVHVLLDGSRHKCGLSELRVLLGQTVPEA